MLLKSTKRFFKNTLQTFKTFLSGGYQKLPKTPTFQNLFSCTTIQDSKMNQSFRELDSFYTDFTTRWDLDTENAKNREKKVIMTKEDPVIKDEDVASKRSLVKLGKQRRDENEGEEYRYLVIQKLKELALMDAGNVDHVFDIQEVLYYYSRITCPAYRDIVDRFFVQVYSEFFQASMCAGNGNSKGNFHC